MSLSKETKCPNCDSKLDMATPANPDQPEATPSENDITICFYCGDIGCYNEDLTIRRATEEDLTSVDESDLVALRNVQKQVRGE